MFNTKGLIGREIGAWVIYKVKWVARKIYIIHYEVGPSRFSPCPDKKLVLIVLFMI
jgi:hypothetical protein